MADIAIPAGTKEIDVVASYEQHTAPAEEDIGAGEAIRFDTNTGKFTLANASSATEGRMYGVAVKKVLAGYPVTGIRRGLLGGFTFTQDYDKAIFLSDTDGALADAAGTQTLSVGRVIPGFAELLGNAPSKLLSIEL